MEEHFGGEVELELIDLRGIKREFARYHIPECEVYLYSLYTLDYNEIVTLVEVLRERFPRAFHITGGPHAMLFEADCREIFDSLVIGEGERLIVDAVEALRGGLRPEKIYRQTDPVDINAFPHPRRHFLAASSNSRPGLMTMKTREGFDKLLSTTVMFSRGCPYGCRFCAIPSSKQYSPGIRYRRPEFIREEIEYLKREYRVEGISLLDEIAIPLNRKAAIAHLNAIGEAGIAWRGQTRVDCLTAELAKLAKQSGCLTMSLGVETVSQRALDIMNKKIKVDEARRTIALLKENGIECRVYLVSGLPGEPDDIVKETLLFLDETMPDLVIVSLFTVRPGTEVFENPEKFGIRSVTPDWENMMNLQDRYVHEELKLSFEYEKVTPWGEGFSRERIVENFLAIKRGIDERGLSSVLSRPGR